MALPEETADASRWHLLVMARDYQANGLLLMKPAWRVASSTKSAVKVANEYDSLIASGTKKSELRVVFNKAVAMLHTGDRISFSFADGNALDTQWFETWHAQREAAKEKANAAARPKRK